MAFAQRNSVQRFIENIPPLTRYTLFTFILMTGLARLQVFSIANCALISSKVFKEYQLSRLILSLVVYPLSPNTGYTFLISVYMYYSMSSSLESSTFSGKRGDHVFMMLFMYLLILSISLFIYPIMFLSSAMIYSVIYVWSQLNSEHQVSFMFGIRMNAGYLPYAILVVNYLIFFRFVDELVAIIVGHMYYFAAFAYTQEYGFPPLIQTPKFLLRFIPNQIATHFQPTRTPFPATSSSSANTTTHHWGGRGRRLDD